MFMPAVGDLVQSTTKRWITHCPNGHRLGQVLVGHHACLGHGGGHATWTAAHATRRVRPAAQDPLHLPRRASDRADLQRRT